MTTINLLSWIEENRRDLEPPVCNKMVHNAGQLKLFAVGGPNQRRDFHIEDGEELFYQVRGGMVLKVIEDGLQRDIEIEEGQVFLLPANVFHSPQRFPGTIGIVIERERRLEEKDGLVYFVHDKDDQPTSEKLYEKYFHCMDLGSQLAPIIRAFFASEQYRTGRPIPEDLVASPAVLPNPHVRCGQPRALKELLSERLTGVGDDGAELLPGYGCQSSFRGFGEGRCRVGEPDGEVWIWVLEGEATAKGEDGRVTELRENDTVLVERGKTFELIRQKGAAVVTYSQTKPKMLFVN